MHNDCRKIRANNKLLKLNKFKSNHYKNFMNISNITYIDNICILTVRQGLQQKYKFLQMS